MDTVVDVLRVIILPVVATILSMVAGYIVHKVTAKEWTLPSYVTQVVKLLGGWETLVAAYQYAESFEDLTSLQKRDRAKDFINNQVSTLGMSINESTLNLIVEFLVSYVEEHID